MLRSVEPEWLDILPADDPSAQHSRRDLQRVNAWMRHPQILSRILSRVIRPKSSVTVIDLGGGDGRLMLRLVRSLHWRNVRLTIVDRQNLITRETREAFAALNWSVEAVVADIRDWLAQPSSDRTDVMIANLVLHHFRDDELAACLQGIAKRARVFVACEPRRAHRAIVGARLLWLIGCNRVSLHDAWTSVRAGFIGTELSQRWPSASDCNIQEYAAGLFTHCFLAQCRPSNDDL
ncbi:MAG: methyltransferase domain-containing protein [Nitrospira sp.]